MSIIGKWLLDIVVAAGVLLFVTLTLAIGVRLMAFHL
jgi:hypothetical protein